MAGYTYGARACYENGDEAWYGATGTHRVGLCTWLGLERVQSYGFGCAWARDGDMKCLYISYRTPRGLGVFQKQSLIARRGSKL